MHSDKISFFIEMAEKKFKVGAQLLYKKLAQSILTLSMWLSNSVSISLKFMTMQIFKWSLIMHATSQLGAIPHPNHGALFPSESHRNRSGQLVAR